MKPQTYYALLALACLAALGLGAAERPLYDGYALRAAFDAMRGPRVHYFHFDNSTAARYDATVLSVESDAGALDGIWRVAPGGGFVSVFVYAALDLDCAEPNATLEFGLFYANLRHVRGGGPGDDDDAGEFLVRDEDYDNYGFAPQDPVTLAVFVVDMSGTDTAGFGERVDLQLYKWGGLRLGVRYTGSCAPTIDVLRLALVPTNERYELESSVSSV